MHILVVKLLQGGSSTTPPPNPNPPTPPPFRPSPHSPHINAALKLSNQLSFATMLADMEAIGYPLSDLACIYQGQDVPSRPNNHRLWLALAALRGGNLLPITPVSGDAMLEGKTAALPTPPLAPRASTHCHSPHFAHCPSNPCPPLLGCAGFSQKSVRGNQGLCSVVFFLPARSVSGASPLLHLPKA